MSSQAVLDAAAKRFASGASTKNTALAPLPPLPAATKNPTAKIDETLKSGLNAGGQPLSDVQKASLQYQKDQLTGKISQPVAQELKTAAAAPASIVSLRDHKKEAEMAKKLGGLPKDAREVAKMIQATYAPDVILKDPELSAMVAAGNAPVNTGLSATQPPAYNSGVAGTSPIYDPSKIGEYEELLKQGFITPEAFNKLKAKGEEVNASQAGLNSIPKPTNATIGVLEQALRIKNGIGTGDPLKSNILKDAGFNQDLNPQTFMAGLQARSQEMTADYDFYKKAVMDKSGLMLNSYNTALDSFKADQAAYEKEMSYMEKAQERLQRTEERIQDHKWTLETMDYQAKKQAEALEKAHAWEEKNTKLQYIPESDIQEAGTFDPVTGEFRPLSSQGSWTTGFTGGGKYEVESTENGIKLNTQVGNNAGQCGRFVNDYLGIPSFMKDSYADKMAKTDPSIKVPAPGMVGVMPYKNTGHTFIVESVDPQNKVVNVVDSNWGLDEKVKRHSIKMSDISGYIVPPKGRTISAEASATNTGSPQESTVSTMKKALAIMKPGSPQAIQYESVIKSLENSSPLTPEREAIRGGQMDTSTITAQRKQYENDIKKYRNYPDKVAETQKQLNQFEEDVLYAKKHTLNPNQQAKAQSIASQFDGEQIVKDYNALIQANNFVQQLDNKSSNPADDQALIYSFAKSMDPAGSVKEGEYKTVQEYTQAVLAKTGFGIKNVFDTSGFLTNEARASLKKTMNSKFSSAEKVYKNLFNEYGRRIELSAQGTQIKGTDYLTDYAGASVNNVQSESGGITLTSPDGKQTATWGSSSDPEVAEARKQGWR